MCDYSLPGANIECSVLVLNAQHSLQHDRKLVELRSLSRLDPSRRTAHMGHAGGRGFGIHASDVFVDKLGLVARGLDASGLSDQCGHEFPPPRAARARISGYTKPGHPDGGTSARNPSCDNLKDRDKGFREWMRFQESRSADPESRSAPGCRELRWAECPEFQECGRCRDSPAGPGEEEEEPAAALQPAPPRLA